MSNPRHPILALLAIAAVPVVVALVLLASMDRFTIAASAIAVIREAAREWWAVPLFFVMYVAFALLLLPVTPLSVAAALAWGWKAGGAMELAACTLAALPPFLFARNRVAMRWLDKRGVALPPFLNDRALFPLLLLRIVPVVPYVALNYIAGLGRFRWRDYLLTTFLGSIPSVFLFAWFVDTMGGAATGVSTQLRILGACVAVALAAVIGRAVAERVRRTSFAARTTPPPDDGDRRSAATALPPE